MERIYKLPFILGCLAAMAAGVASYAAGAESRTIYLRMAVMMLTFFIIGLYVKNTILSIENEVQVKKHQIHKLDLPAEDTRDDFEPLAISKAIRSKTKD